MTPRVEMLWWSGCPHWERALADLRGAMVEHELDPGSIELREMVSDEQAEVEGFPGSPTILVDGADVAEVQEASPRGLSCRMYLSRRRRVTPVPDPLDVREALAAAAG